MPERGVDAPLRGRTVLITAPPAYAGRLEAALGSLGAEVVRCPTIDTRLLLRNMGMQSASPCEAAARGDELCAALEVAVGTIYEGRYSDVYFCSRRAVEAFIHLAPRLQAAATTRSVERVRLWALGADAGPLEAALGTQAWLGAARFEVCRPAASTLLLPPSFSPRTALVLAPRVEPPLEEPHVVPDLLDGLREPQELFAAGVDLVHAYQTLALSPTSEALALLSTGSVDAICFSSILEAEGLLLHWRPRPTGSRSVRPRLCCFGPSTARGVAKALGASCPDDLLVNEDFASFAGFARTLATHLGAVT